MIGGVSGVTDDIIPYGTATASRASLSGLNLVGLKRKGASRESIHALRSFYKKLFDKETGTVQENLQSLKTEYGDDELVKNVINFLETKSSRSICTPKDN